MAKAASNTDTTAGDRPSNAAVAPDSGGSILGMAASVFILAVTAVATLFAKAWHAINEGGHVKAAPPFSVPIVNLRLQIVPALQQRTIQRGEAVNDPAKALPKSRGLDPGARKHFV